MIKPITFTILFIISMVEPCFSSGPTIQLDIPEYRTEIYRDLMLNFVPIGYIHNSCKTALHRYKEIANCLHSKYGREKVISIPLLKNDLRSYTRYDDYEYVLDILFDESIIFDINYLEDNRLTTFIVSFSKSIVKFRIPSDIVGVIQRFLRCISYEKEIKFGTSYHDEYKNSNTSWRVGLLGNVLHTASHFWMLHYKNRNGKEGVSPTTQLKVKVYEPKKRSHHFFRKKMGTNTVVSFSLKKQFTFFRKKESKNLQGFCVLQVAPKKYLLVNSLGNKFQPEESRVEYSIVSKKEIRKGKIGTSYFWGDIASHHSQNRVNILGATARGIELRTLDCNFNSFLPSQYRSNFMRNYSFYKIFAHSTHQTIWGLCNRKAYNHSACYYRYSGALFFDVNKEINTIHLLSKKSTPFSSVDRSGDYVALSKYEDRTINIFDQRAPFHQSVTTYSLEKISYDRSIQKANFLSDPRYLLAECKTDSYLIDRRYATPVLDILNFAHDEKVFLKDYNLLTSTHYGISNISYISIDTISAE